MVVLYSATNNDVYMLDLNGCDLENGRIYFYQNLKLFKNRFRILDWDLRLVSQDNYIHSFFHGPNELHPTKIKTQSCRSYTGAIVTVPLSQSLKDQLQNHIPPDEFSASPQKITLVEIVSYCFSVNTRIILITYLRYLDYQKRCLKMIEHYLELDIGEVTSMTCQSASEITGKIDYILVASESLKVIYEDGKFSLINFIDILGRTIQKVFPVRSQIGTYVIIDGVLHIYDGQDLFEIMLEGVREIKSSSRVDILRCQTSDYLFDHVTKKIVPFLCDIEYGELKVSGDFLAAIDKFDRLHVTNLNSWIEQTKPFVNEVFPPISFTILTDCPLRLSCCNKSD